MEVLLRHNKQYVMPLNDRTGSIVMCLWGISYVMTESQKRQTALAGPTATHSLFATQQQRHLFSVRRPLSGNKTPYKQNGSPTDVWPDLITVHMH